MLFTLEYVLASPEEQKNMDAAHEAANETFNRFFTFDPPVNDAGYSGQSLVDNKMFRNWEKQTSKFWDYLYENEKYDALVEEMQSPMLHVMNYRILFNNC